MLADEFWRIAHDEISGRPRLHERAAALGLSAALIAELLLPGNIALYQDGLVVISSEPPGCPVAHLALTEISGEREHAHPLKTWLQFFATDAHRRIGDRMVRAGHLRPETRRARLVGRPVTTYVPTDPLQSARPVSLLTTNLRTGRPLGRELSVLAGFAWATGLGPVLLDGAPPEATPYLEETVRGLGYPVIALVSATRDAVNAAVMSGL